jgi:exopolysaccharide biosynthesis polyprenyl glycosylphosphotransferase
MSERAPRHVPDRMREAAARAIHPSQPAEQARPDLHIVGSVEHRPQTSAQSWGRVYRERLLLSDTLIILATVIGALLTELRPGTIMIAGIICAVWMTFMSTFRTRDLRAVSVGSAEYKRVVTACVTALGVLAIASTMLQLPAPNRYFALVLPVGAVALTASRWVWRHWLWHQRRFGHFLYRVIVVGGRSDVDYVVGRIEANCRGAYSVVGVVIDGQKPKKQREQFSSFPRFYGLDSVTDIAGRLQVDAVIVAGRANSGGDFIRSLAWKLEGTAAELILAARLTDVAGPRIHFRPVEGLPLIHVEIPQFDGGKHLLKRAFDIAVSSIALVVLLPLFAAIAIAVKLDSDGPVLFRQERVGRNGKTFQMLKFRSMYDSASERLDGLLAQNEGAGLLFKMKDDPRVTAVGRVLRKHSLDEFPQLLNVLAGDMSLVGPRPPLPREVLSYEGSVHRRLFIRPGLTGMWQVNGRSDLNWEESVRLDLYYVENWSLIGDLVIMWRTLRVLIHPVGAY